MAYHPPKATDEWGTPPEVFDPLNAEFKFDLDVAASASNTKCNRFFDLEEDGLTQPWSGRCWMNPPYGRVIAKWIEKAATSTAELVVGLLPARTDTRWFHDHILGKAEIRFVKGRIYFENPSFIRDRAPFPSMVVIWRSTPCRKVSSVIFAREKS